MPDIGSYDNTCPVAKSHLGGYITNLGINNRKSFCYLRSLFLLSDDKSYARGIISRLCSIALRIGGCGSCFMETSWGVTQQLCRMKGKLIRQFFKTMFYR